MITILFRFEIFFLNHPTYTLTKHNSQMKRFFHTLLSTHTHTLGWVLFILFLTLQPFCCWATWFLRTKHFTIANFVFSLHYSKGKLRPPSTHTPKTFSHETSINYLTPKQTGARDASEIFCCYHCCTHFTSGNCCGVGVVFVGGIKTKFSLLWCRWLSDCCHMKYINAEKK